jgi:hypothetical protein
MSKKTLRVTAIAVGLCFVLALAPMLKSAEKQPVSSSIKILSLLKKPFFLLGSLLNLFPYPPVLDNGNSTDGMYVSNGTTTTSKGIGKTTEDTPSVPPIKKD